MKILVVMTTLPSEAEAEKLAASLVEKRLAACVQIMPQITSFYHWQGKLAREAEHLLLIKTTEDAWPALTELVAEEHPYDIPELIALDAEKASDPYAGWLRGEVT